MLRRCLAAWTTRSTRQNPARKARGFLFHHERVYHGAMVLVGAEAFSLRAETTEENLRRRKNTERQKARDAHARGDSSWRTFALCAALLTVVLARVAAAAE